MNEHIALTVLAPRCDRYAMRLTVGEHSARHVRRIVRSLLREWETEEVSDAVELGVTELLANVVRHVPGRRCALLVLRRPLGSAWRWRTAAIKCRAYRATWRPTRNTAADSCCWPR